MLQAKVLVGVIAGGDDSGVIGCRFSCWESHF
uniref:Uncharacterized protein n=1 Tax=Setaria viridis TaxID=4556 RepID=A0A4U6W6P4_SETVI|nr:hypothetical protein SEVIR_1G078042v2 [Setaria viridis]